MTSFPLYMLAQLRPQAQEVERGLSSRSSLGSLRGARAVQDALFLDLASSHLPASGLMQPSSNLSALGRSSLHADFPYRRRIQTAGSGAGEGQRGRWSGEVDSGPRC